MVFPELARNFWWWCGPRLFSASLAHTNSQALTLLDGLCVGTYPPIDLIFSLQLKYVAALSTHVLVHGILSDDITACMELLLLMFPDFRSINWLLHVHEICILESKN